MAEELTISEAQKKKHELERELEERIKKFEAETGLDIFQISLDKINFSTPFTRQADIRNVHVNIEVDL